jgi:uncharacterized membrane-anchored protein YhcB (DUF1043 family)
MKIKDILTLDLTEDIKNVIDLEDISEAEIKIEIEGYIVTEGLAKEYSRFVNIYTGNIAETGVWLSGFYGSGKSYFGKLLGYMLSNQTIAGTPARDRILQRFGGINDEALVKNSILRLDSIASRVVFLDIAKQDTSKGFAYALFKNFLKSLNLPQNEHGFLLYNLMMNDQQASVDDFIYQNTTKHWKDIKSNRIKYIKFIQDIFLNKGNTDADYNNMLETIRRDIDEFSAGRLREEVSNYLQVKSNERIVFLFDETSEALNQKKFTLLDLEGVSESLSALGGQVWTIAIAQEKLDDVINNSNINKATLTKVTDRFKTKIHLEATEVDIIIKNRLLQKTSDGIKALEEHYQKNSGKIKDHAALVGGITKTDSFESYSTYYPFYKYQFDLLQNFLFGTKGYASTKVAARGMIITAYEILKLDVQNTALFRTVTGWQIAKQGQPQPDVRLVSRYDGAERILREASSSISGRKLLETINLLYEAEVTPTTIPNIIKAYSSDPEEYYRIKVAIETALETLTENKILLDTNKTYRITSDIEQRLLDEMSGFTVQTFIKKKQLADYYKSANFTKVLSRITDDSLPYDFYITTDNDDELTRPNQKSLGIKFKSIYNFSDDRSKDIEGLKTEYQQDTSTLWLVPSNEEYSEIDRLIDDVERITYLEQKYNNPNSDEGKVMLSFLASKDEKQNRIKILIERAFVNGMAIYLYNTFQLTDSNWEVTLKTQQRQVIQNVYAKRLNNQLSDSLAKLIIRENKNDRLRQHFSGKDFEFFDGQGNFIGERLKVVEEITYKIRNTYVDGKTLEDELEKPPTGFTFGTVISTLAALMRGGRVIAKYNGSEFFAWSDKGVLDMFSTAREFRKASFKAISKSLSATQKQGIAQSLLNIDVAQYRDRNEVKIDFNTNDFELINAVRGLAKYFSQTVTTLKRTEAEFDKLFPHIQAKVDYLSDFTGAVSEANYIDKAEKFLAAQTDFYEAIDAIKKVESFISKKLPKSKIWKAFVEEVKEDLKKAAQKNTKIDALATEFNSLYVADIVQHYTTLRSLMQNVKDEYFQLFSAVMKDCAAKYTELQQLATGLINEINTLPQGLNNLALDKASRLVRYANQRTQANIKIDFNVKDKNSHFTYSEVLSFIDLYNSKKTEVEITQASLIRVAPSVVNKDYNKDKVEEPAAAAIVKIHTYKTKLPAKNLDVFAYKKWLRNELQKLASAKDEDKIELED